MESGPPTSSKLSPQEKMKVHPEYRVVGTSLLSMNLQDALPSYVTEMVSFIVYLHTVRNFVRGNFYCVLANTNIQWLRFTTCPSLGETPKC